VELLFGVIATFFLWLPTEPENSSFVLSCLGEDDAIYFDFDYFTPGGYTRNKVAKILKVSLDLILLPSPSVKIQIIGGKVYLR
jgi:hypothetical protein